MSKSQAKKFMDGFSLPTGENLRLATDLLIERRRLLDEAELISVRQIALKLEIPISSVEALESELHG